MERKAGVLLHISSLPNKYGIGTLGKEAYGIPEKEQPQRTNFIR